MTDDMLSEAADALRAAGHKVEPMGDDFALWFIDGQPTGDRELIALALRMELITEAVRDQ